METRLNLLCDAGVIDKDICKGMMQVVNVLETECHLPVRSEQGTMAMTHMASPTRTRISARCSGVHLGVKSRRTFASTAVRS